MLAWRALFVVQARHYWVMPDVTIPVPGVLPAYVAVPAREGPWPGVVVVHDAFGMSSDLKMQADWLASEGYLAAAPDLYRGGNKLLCMRAVIGDALARKIGRASCRERVS